LVGYLLQRPAPHCGEVDSLPSAEPTELVPKLSRRNRPQFNSSESFAPPENPNGAV
jgi:hypothetical protein